MAWALPYLYFQFLLQVRSTTEIGGVALDTLLILFVGCIALFLIGVRVRRFAFPLLGTRAAMNWRAASVFFLHK